MPVYACCRSDCGHLAIQGPDGFVLKDALGRDWLCVETPLSDLAVDVSQALDAISDVRRRADRLGVHAEGAQLTLIDCPGRSSLLQELVRASCPSPAESMHQLREAGWRNLREEVWAPNKVRVAATSADSVSRGGHGYGRLIHSESETGPGRFVLRIDPFRSKRGAACAICR
jgi:hypothetical protein